VATSTSDLAMLIRPGEATSTTTPIQVQKIDKIKKNKNSRKSRKLIFCVILDQSWPAKKANFFCVFLVFLISREFYHAPMTYKYLLKSCFN
jgi:hypothetical protein